LIGGTLSHSENPRSVQSEAVAAQKRCRVCDPRSAGIYEPSVQLNIRPPTTEAFVCCAAARHTSPICLASGGRLSDRPPLNLFGQLRQIRVFLDGDLDLLFARGWRGCSPGGSQFQDGGFRDGGFRRDRFRRTRFQSRRACLTLRRDGYPGPVCNSADTRCEPSRSKRRDTHARREADHVAMSGQSHGFPDQRILSTRLRHITGPQGVRAEIPLQPGTLRPPLHEMPLWRPPKWKVTVIGSLLTPRRGWSDGGVEGSKNHDPSSGRCGPKFMPRSLTRPRGRGRRHVKLYLNY
jgi:hypothetical protein